jgi:hypothetical protein
MNVEARAMLVRLAAAWIDPTGVVHGAGEHVDIDAVTLAVLEEQGVVENMTDPKETWTGPDGTETTTTTDPESDWTGPDGTDTGGETDWTGPDSTDPDDGK